MKISHFAVTLAGCFVFWTGSVQAAILVHYKFAEGSGSTTGNAGTQGNGLDLTFQADGSGRVPGFSSDTPAGLGYSLDNTSVVGTDGGKAVTSNPLSALPSLTEATVTGWYKLQNYGYLSRLLNRAANDIAGGGGGWALYFLEDGKLTLQVVSTNYGSDNNWGTLDQWYFFAVTFQSSILPEAKVSFYRGSTTTSAGFVASANSQNNFLPGAFDQYPLTVAGRHGSFNRGLDGLMYDVRIYDEVLTPAQIEGIRNSAIPEPVTLGLIGIGAVAMMLRRRCGGH